MVRVRDFRMRDVGWNAMEWLAGAANRRQDLAVHGQEMMARLVRKSQMGYTDDLSSSEEEFTINITIMSRMGVQLVIWSTTRRCDNSSFQGLSTQMLRIFRMSIKQGCIPDVRGSTTSLSE